MTSEAKDVYEPDQKYKKSLPLVKTQKSEYNGQKCSHCGKRIKVTDRFCGLSYERTDHITHQRLYYYQQAMYSIYKFVKTTYDLIPQTSKGGALFKKDYFLDFASPSIESMTLIQSFEKAGRPPLPTEYIANGYDYNYWSTKINYAFQKVFHLCKFRGFDPFFRPLQDGETLDRHHFRVFPFRKMSSHVRDFVMTTQSYHKADFEQLYKEMGWLQAEAYVEALIGTIEELDGLREHGKIKQITEQDLINALKHNFGAEWRDPYNRILEKNDGDLEEAIKVFNERGKEIQNNGYSGFLEVDFNSAYTKQLSLVNKIQLAKVLGVIASKEDFLIFDEMFPGMLPLPRNFARITNFI